MIFYYSFTGFSQGKSELKIISVDTAETLNVDKPRFTKLFFSIEHIHSIHHEDLSLPLEEAKPGRDALENFGHFVYSQTQNVYHKTVYVISRNRIFELITI